MLESSVLIAAERRKFDLTGFLAAYPGELLTLAAITVSELRHGCYRAVDRNIRERREQFVADILYRAAIVPFGAVEAECHAQLWVELERRGQMIGSHDLLIAATASSGGHRLATLNESEFRRVGGLALLSVAEWQRSV